jgi:hypothetical protein
MQWPQSSDNKNRIGLLLNFNYNTKVDNGFIIIDKGQFERNENEQSVNR